ncbi:hypothetical protein SAMN05216197_1451 [Pseudomonas graminis]|uniref:Rha family transcriptional regulator n=3 Tax=Pseudomonas graminis TaxID=158627 RepID=A0A1I0IZ86_9PSED|nr:phage regulatory CII family protein [Pseudomonas graminis]SEU02764.1 hypothetical protein SAMN05216197_1451 [Pseudomonas graminis]
MEDFLRACHTTVKESGAEELAGKMCLAHVSLLQRSNPDNAAHHLTIEHLFGVLLHTQDMRPLMALAAGFGFDLVAKEQPAAIDVHQALGNVTLEISEVTVETHRAMADGRVDQVERARIMREIAEAEKALHVLKVSIKAA